MYTIYSNSMKIRVSIIHNKVNTFRHVHNMVKNSKHFRQSCKHKPNYESMNIESIGKYIYKKNSLLSLFSFVNKFFVVLDC